MDMATTVQLLSAVVTAVGTVILAYVTYVLSAETRRLAEVSARPQVICYLESSLAGSDTMNLTFRNTGNAPAFDVEFTISPPMPLLRDGQEVSSDQFSILPPDTVIPLAGVLSNKLPNVDFTVTVSWTRAPGGTRRESLTYPLKPSDGFRGGWVIKGVHQLVEETGKIREEIGKLGRTRA